MSAPREKSRRMPNWVGDVLIALILIGSTFVPYRGDSGRATAIGAIFVLLPAVVLPFRRKFPWAVLAICVACFGVTSFTFPLSPFSSLAVAIAVYAIAVTSDRRSTLIAAAVAIAPMVVIAGVARSGAFDPAVFQVLVTIGFAAAAGDAVRSRRAYITEVTERAVRAEQARDSEASRRVAEERLRIARDLHDAVAHQISVISLNAGLASSTMESRPEVARDSLMTIRTASRQVLGEIGDLLKMLRSPEDISTAPRSLTQVDELVQRYVDAGLAVTVRIEGDIDHMPLAVDVAAYRILQEALTNAHKHGVDHRAHVLLSATDDELAILVTNPRAMTESPTADNGGNGLIGIREHASSVRGRAWVDDHADAFRLHAKLPLGTSNGATE